MGDNEKKKKKDGRERRKEKECSPVVSLVIGVPVSTHLYSPMRYLHAMEAKVFVSKT